MQRWVPFALGVVLGVGLVPAWGGVEPVVARLVEPAPSATVLFGGDMMFDRTIRQYADRHGGDYLFGCIDSTLAHADLVVANLEGPITDNPSVSEGSAVGSGDNYTFTFSTTTALLLAAHRVGAVSLGNNHIDNQGVAGVRSTTQYLDAAGVRYFGDPLSNNITDVDAGGVPLTLVNYNDFIPRGGTASTTLAQIVAARARGRVPVVYAHWGVEYATSAPARVVALAHAFVDAGAKAVVGSHPHVVEQSEVYDGARIYYSLGNFIFDQYWDDAVTHGLLVEVTFSPAGATSVKEIPVALSRDRRVCPIGDNNL
jgi:poly-gamma-glutamate capsule biosynthesis protein CapA/YwtB (metallophosphatase superfamily)